ncbi:hypothetical protein EOI86_04820 [Hwanghaeella grinnelliae]|uniref:CoA transferase n=1 Tax=Hwanghaeella grinnelliae TaxID=2500179 RepID=A0A3S2Y4W1_9PROT|nr:CoA transferase [Hwanghaeella grinnelliae]RVU38605.1 hypothetical protein EOI86_04820 [Hwanghaeella grinnelliae]
MYDLIAGLRIVEVSAFVAAPFAPLTLSQLGADVIRIDPEGGGIDYRRRPLSDDQTSLYWAGLNKGKRSVALDLRSADGQEKVDQPGIGKHLSAGSPINFVGEKRQPVRPAVQVGQDTHAVLRNVSSGRFGSSMLPE